MKVGDLIVCDCKSDMWYSGVPGLVVAYRGALGSEILYFNGKIRRLGRQFLRVLSGN